MDIEYDTAYKVSQNISLAGQHWHDDKQPWVAFSYLLTPWKILVISSLNLNKLFHQVFLPNECSFPPWREK